MISWVPIEHSPGDSDRITCANKHGVAHASRLPPSFSDLLELGRAISQGRGRNAGSTSVRTVKRTTDRHVRSESALAHQTMVSGLAGVHGWWFQLSSFLIIAENILTVDKRLSVSLTTASRCRAVHVAPYHYWPWDVPASGSHAWH
jgi:hypothetical protein